MFRADKRRCFQYVGDRSAVTWHLGITRIFRDMHSQDLLLSTAHNATCKLARLGQSVAASLWFGNLQSTVHLKEEMPNLVSENSHV